MLGIRSVMVPDGYLFISTPNLDARKQEEITRWTHWKPKEHLWLYGYESINKLLKTCGFEVIEYNTTESAFRVNRSSKYTDNIMTVIAKPIPAKEMSFKSDELKYINTQYNQLTSAVYSTG